MKSAQLTACIAAAVCLRSALVCAQSVTINTPVGPVEIGLSHAGPDGRLVEPDAPQSAGFRPPAIFAAPLPTGSGARALGQAGAFTAVADDATAASWNPAGLILLEAPEASVVYRFSAREDVHHSSRRDLLTDRDAYNSSELNYASAVYPFLLNGNNAVFSINYQEAYDFTQRFTARFAGSSSKTLLTEQSQTFHEITTNQYSSADLDLLILADVTTLADSRIDQLLDSSLLTDLEFVQKGTIDAISPAFAVEFTPRFSVGAALNFYTDGASRGNPIRSTLVAGYSGTSGSIAEITDTRSSVANVDWSGALHGENPQDPAGTPISGTEDPVYFSDTDGYSQTGIYQVNGTYRESNRTDQFYGINATLGALWNAIDRLTLGAAVDLPWTGHGSQTKKIFHQATTFNSNGVQVAQSAYRETLTRDVEYTFPLYWSVGALWRWNDRLYSSMDVSRTHWSDFSYKAEGEGRINPLDGELSSVSKIDDCWSVRFGSEYLCVLSWTEIPVRGGVFWEQRPAVGEPDQYWGFSLGSGISLGKDPGKIILDIAYTFERGENVMGSLLPEQGVYSDSTKHQFIISAIWHF